MEKTYLQLPQKVSNGCLSQGFYLCLVQAYHNVRVTITTGCTLNANQARCILKEDTQDYIPCLHVGLSMGNKSWRQEGAISLEDMGHVHTINNFVSRPFPPYTVFDCSLSTKLDNRNGVGGRLHTHTHLLGPTSCSLECSTPMQPVLPSPCSAS